MKTLLFLLLSAITASAAVGVAPSGGTASGGSDASFSGTVDAAQLYTGSFKLYRSALTPVDAGTQLNFGSTNRYWSCTLTGNVTFATANLTAGAHANIMLTGVSTNAKLTFPATWIFIGYKPTYLTATKHADLYLKSTGTTDAEVWAYYGEQQ